MPEEYSPLLKSGWFISAFHSNPKVVRDAQVKPNTYDVLGRGFYRKDEEAFEKTVLEGGQPLKDLHDARFVVYRPIFHEVRSSRSILYYVQAKTLA